MIGQASDLVFDLVRQRCEGDSKSIDAAVGVCGTCDIASSEDCNQTSVKLPVLSKLTQDRNHSQSTCSLQARSSPETLHCLSGAWRMTNDER